MREAEIEFGYGAEGAMAEEKWKERCEDVAFVVECLRKYQRWRKGEGEYAPVDDPEKELPMPFCPRALTIVEDAAISMLEDADGRP